MKGEMPAPRFPVGVLQCGTDGKADGTLFRVVGWRQHVSERRRWVEWFASCSDGRECAIVRVDGEYLLGFPYRLRVGFPDPRAFMPNSTVILDDLSYRIHRILISTVVCSDGELPVDGQPGHNVLMVLLFGRDERFAWLQYTLHDTQMWIGHAVSYEQLALEKVRELDGWR